MLTLCMFFFLLAALQSLQNLSSPTFQRFRPWDPCVGILTTGFAREITSLHVHGCFGKQAKVALFLLKNLDLWSNK